MSQDLSVSLKLGRETIIRNSHFTDVFHLSDRDTTLRSPISKETNCQNSKFCKNLCYKIKKKNSCHIKWQKIFNGVYQLHQ